MWSTSPIQQCHAFITYEGFRKFLFFFMLVTLQTREPSKRAYTRDQNKQDHDVKLL
ncbi:hypothetical protein JHK82_028938 [Glycine max]|nr:hypothetical protein JHK82_028938 [Glycine max]